ncbi:MAG TPA: DM13 domain-containing protein [Saprospiraceae bacterium]
MNHRSFLLMLTVFSAIFLFSACEKDDPDTPPDNPSFRGEFVDAVHSTSGTASIDIEKTTLTLTNFKTDSGPDLNIYLTTGLNNITTEFIDLGDIKGRDGTYTYTLPGNTDYTNYKFVIVWCVDFSVNFGYAELVEQ